jgi:hypothetical protein
LLATFTPRSVDGEYKTPFLKRELGFWFFKAKWREISLMPHKWTYQDDLVVLYLFKFGNDKIPHTMDQIAENRNMSLGSLIMRLSNMSAVAGQGGLSHFGKITQKVYSDHNNKTEPELKELAFPELFRRAKPN